MKYLLLILINLFIFVSCSGGRNSTGYSLINDMMYSETYEAFSENPVFDNGQSMQNAPANTIARGFMPHPLAEDGSPEVLANPYEMNDYKWVRGKNLFDSTCASCHGISGDGDGLVVEVGNFPKPPQFNSRRFKYTRKDDKPSGYVYNVITFGIGNMSSHAQQLYAEDRWSVAEYVREKLMIKDK